jgi:6-pyruvoyltetrahydropterin/6-carboxytetrahydropterin synthase
MKISKEFTFDSAHHLPNVPAGHKCGRLHGHTYRIRIEVDGPIHPEYGWVIDYGDIKQLWKPIEDQLDHRYLNEIKGLENPTAEVIAKWIWDHLKPTLPILSCVYVHETCTTAAMYSGE